jgi:hypothetical protein
MDDKTLRFTESKTLVWPHDVASFQGSTFCLFVMVQSWNIGVCWIDQVFVTELTVVIFCCSSHTRCFVMWYINVIFIKFIKFTTYETVLIYKFSTVFSFMRHPMHEIWRDTYFDVVEGWRINICLILLEFWVYSYSM